MLPASRNAAFLQGKSNEAGPPRSDTAVKKGWLENAIPCRTIPLPRESVQLGTETVISPIHITRAALTYAATAFRLKRRGLADVLQLSANRHRRQDEPANHEIYRRLAAAFSALAPILGRAENCLPRSIAFHALAYAAGHVPSLVIGVKRDPFSAHCWVQDGTLVLNDSAEHVRIFTPILII